jgi:chemotaxis protein MotB
MMFKKNYKNEEENLDRWLLTYSDLITLLLGLFVILYASSQIDIEKFKKFSVALGERFGVGLTEGTPFETAIADSIIILPEIDEMEYVKEGILEAVSHLPEKYGLKFEKNQVGLVISFSDKVLFEVGKADLKASSFNILRAVGYQLREIDNDILLEGHTDNTPINTPQFPSNLHLSLFRAININYFFINDCEIPPERMSVQGYAEFRPVRPNDTEDNKAMNRRVDIVVVYSKFDNRKQ